MPLAGISLQAITSAMGVTSTGIPASSDNTDTKKENEYVDITNKIYVIKVNGWTVFFLLTENLRFPHFLDLKYL